MVLVHDVCNEGIVWGDGVFGSRNPDEMCGTCLMIVVAILGFAFVMGSGRRRFDAEWDVEGSVGVGGAVMRDHESLMAPCRF